MTAAADGRIVTQTAIPIHARNDVVRSTGGPAKELLAPIAAEEAKLPLATRAFLNSAITAVPALLLGFICQEGTDLVRRRDI